MIIDTHYEAFIVMKIQFYVSHSSANYSDFLEGFL